MAKCPYCLIYLSETYQTERHHKIIFILKHVRTWVKCTDGQHIGTPAAWNVNGGYTRIFQTSVQTLSLCGNDTSLVVGGGGWGHFLRKTKTGERNKCILDNIRQILKLLSYAISHLWLWQRWWDDHMVSSWHPLMLIHLSVLASIPNLKITNNFKICSHLHSLHHPYLAGPATSL